jgi:hypothetical protein
MASRNHSIENSKRVCALVRFALLAALLNSCTSIEKGPIDTVEIYSYRVTVVMTQSELANGCVAKDSEVGNDLTDVIQVRVPLGEEYQVDLVPYWAIGSISSGRDSEYYCQSNDKLPAPGDICFYPAVWCYASRNVTEQELVSAQIIDTLGQEVTADPNAGRASTTVSGGYVQRFTLVANATGPVWLARSEGDCAIEPRRDLGLLTVIGP